MEQNVILAGVGGQGILTIAKAISTAALHRGLNLRQSEVHGMSQRGGAVQSHLRISDRELASDLIPFGKADMVLSVEPLESLRYLQYLQEEGVLIASTNAFVNMNNYPPIEQVLERIARIPNHVLIDADRLSRQAGSARSANIVIVGAASLFLPFELAEIEEAVTEMFSSKGHGVVEMNRRALRFGRTAAAAYLDGMRRGNLSTSVRHWIDTLPEAELASAEAPTAAGLGDAVVDERLSGAEIHAFEDTLRAAVDGERRQLFEHEVYTLIELVGAISPPRYLFVPRGAVLSAEALDLFPGERLVLKIVSPQIVHKSDARGVVFVTKELTTVKREIERMVAQHSQNATVEGVLVVEYIERAHAGFGGELFVGIRATREFGPVIAAGLGGVDTEYLARKMLPGVAVAKAVVADTTAEKFLELFRRTAAYDVLAGLARGHQRIVSDGELLRCFRAFLAIARRFCTHHGPDTPCIEELEVNPFAFRQQRMIPLDGRARIGAVTRMPEPRPIAKAGALLEPRSIAVLGVSSTSQNMGRIILNNIRTCGFPADHLCVVKPDATDVDGIRCVPNLASLPEPIDMLLVATPANQLPVIIDDIAGSGRVKSAILIPGGVGETEGSDEVQRKVHQAMLAARALPDGGPVFLGPNCLGVQSRPGRYDTFFIPQHKLDKKWDAPARRVALISQSGAFIITRLSNLESLNPALAISIGNQFDLTTADLLEVVSKRNDIDAIGVYVEGFNDYDGLAFLKAVEQATAAGKIVIFYKAGRTESGRSAAAGHTASLAGDYDVCQAAAAQAGALVVDTFKEFEQLIELATDLHAKPVRGRRIGAISNAGYETVGMADAIRGARYELTMPALTDATRKRLSESLASHKLDKLVNARNPLDLTPMAGDAAYEDCAKVLVEAEELDALIVSIVPLTPALLTTPDEIVRPGSLVERLARAAKASPKPIVVVIDSGSVYDALARGLRDHAIPVFRTCDQAVRSLGRYLCHRAPAAPPEPHRDAPAPTFKSPQREPVTSG